MAIIENSLRVFRRDKNGIMIYLRMEDWPEDIPLPEGTRIMEIANGAFWPNWHIVLKPDKTIEQVFGWFIVPALSVEETFKWYQTEMEKQGWVEQKRADTLPTWAMLHYHHPGTEVKVAISIWRNSHLNRTQPMIRRITVHPYAPSEAGERSDTEGMFPPMEQAVEQ